MKVVIIKNNGRIELISSFVRKDIPKGCEYKIIKESELPDYYFFDAWNYDLTIDIDTAKEIYKERMLAKLTKLEIFTQQEKISEALQKIDKCKTIDEIKKVKV